MIFQGLFFRLKTFLPILSFLHGPIEINFNTICIKYQFNIMKFFLRFFQINYLTKRLQLQNIIGRKTQVKITTSNRIRGL